MRIAPINADMKSDWSRQDLVVASKTWQVWPDRIFPSPLPLSLAHARSRNMVWFTRLGRNVVLYD